MIARYLLSLWLLLSLVGCSLFRSLPSLPEPQGAPLPRGEFRSITNNYEERLKHIATYRSLSDVVLEDSDGRQRLRYVVVVNEQRDVRIEVLAPSMALALQLLVVKDGQATILLPHEKRAYTGAFDSDLLEQVLGIEGDIDQLLSLLTGSLDSDEFQAYMLEDTIEVVSNNPTRYALYDSALKGLARIDFGSVSDDELVLGAQYQGYMPVGSLLLPRGIKLHFLDKDLKAEIRFRFQKINTPIREDLFQLEIPSDYRRSSL